MGNIRAAIALYDGVTSPLQSMHKAMGVVLNTFEAMQQASGRAVDTAAIREAREEWAKAGTAFDTIEENIRNANNEQQNFNNSIRGGSNSANGLLSIIKKVAIAAGGIAGINKVLNISDELASTKARLNLLVDDGGSVEALEQKIMASAQRSRSVYFDTASAVAKLGLNAGNAFDGNMDQVIAFMEQVNKQFVIGGATAQEQSNAMMQLTQAMAAGALRGEELNSILDGAPGIARAIEKYMGIAEGSIKSVAQEGKVTAEVVKNAMFAMADETNAKFDSMPKTWAQIWAGMKNQALSMFAPILTKINQIANSSKFQQVTTALINGLAGVANIASSVLDILISIASVIVDNWSWIQPIIMGIVAAMLIYNGVMLVGNTIMAVQAAVKAIHTAMTTAWSVATFTATAAQQGLNAALLACPLTWIILLIIAVIAAIYAACAAVAKFTGIANSGFGVICGGIMVVISFFKNLGLSVANIALGIWNALGACASNIGTAFHNVISNVQGWFYNLLSTALTVVAGICEALNSCPSLSSTIPGSPAKQANMRPSPLKPMGMLRNIKALPMPSMKECLPLTPSKMVGPLMLLLPVPLGVMAWPIRFPVCLIFPPWILWGLILWMPSTLAMILIAFTGTPAILQTTQRPPLMPWILLKKIWPIFVTLRSVKQSTGSLPLKSRLNSTMKTTFPKMLIWMGSWMLGPMTLLKSWKFLKKGCMSNGV